MELKYLLSVILLSLIFLKCKHKENPKGGEIGITQISIDTVIKNIGDVKQYDDVETEFRIKNIGKKMLVLSDVTADCHCTKVVWSKKPINCNDYTIIKVKYDSRIVGFFQQAVNIDLNTKEQHLICLIRGKVISK